MKRNNHEPRLCPNCPLTTAWKQEALQRLKEKQYTIEKEEPTALQICMERRRIMKELGLGSCPYFSESETLDYHTNPAIPPTNRPQKRKEKTAKPTTLPMREM